LDYELSRLASIAADADLYDAIYLLSPCRPN